MKKFFLEICVDAVESAIAAQAGGADRVELCANLNEDGTTPSAGTIALARQSLQIGLHVMIRPRGGDFVYSEVEFTIMQKDIAVAKELGVDGVVFGILKTDRTLDVARTRRLVELARPLAVTFHRAFDVVAEPQGALEELLSLRIDRLLTSGQAKTAPQGLPVIRRLVQQAAGRIKIMPACGINPQNIRHLINKSGVSDIHVGSAVTTVNSEFLAELFPTTRRIVDPAKVQELIKLMQFSS